MVNVLFNEDVDLKFCFISLLGTLEPYLFYDWSIRSTLLVLRCYFLIDTHKNKVNYQVVRLYGVFLLGKI